MSWHQTNTKSLFRSTQNRSKHTSSTQLHLQSVLHQPRTFNSNSNKEREWRLPRKSPSLFFNFAKARMKMKWAQASLCSLSSNMPRVDHQGRFGTYNSHATLSHTSCMCLLLLQHGLGSVRSPFLLTTLYIVTASLGSTSNMNGCINSN